MRRVRVSRSWCLRVSAFVANEVSWSKESTEYELNIICGRDAMPSLLLIKDDNRSTDTVPCFQPTSPHQTEMNTEFCATLLLLLLLLLLFLVG